MKAADIKVLGVSAVFLCVVIGAAAQDRAPTAADPRVGLKAGLRDAGTASRNMELVSHLPKPDGFFDPGAPAGTPTPPEPDPNAPPEKSADELAAAGLPPPPPPPSGMSFANSDMAFSVNRAFLGNFHGFNLYDIEDPKKPRLAASVVCPGGQGDMSVYGHLLFVSVEQTLGRIDCGSEGIKDKVSPQRFRGIRIFDIRNANKPKQIAAVQTCRGSHTHTLVVDPKDRANLYIYGSGTGTVRPGEELEGCSGPDPKAGADADARAKAEAEAKNDPNTSLFSIDVIQVPLASPEKARIVNRPRIFADAATGAISGLWAGGDHGPGTQKTSVTNQCHDITVFPEIGLAAGACSGNGILLDIADPVHPVRLDQVLDPNFAYWHSATFNNDGTKVIFTDEWGGGTRPRCRYSDPITWGADAIFDIVDRKLHFAGYYKLPAAQTEQENCVAHNGGLIPVPGRDIMAQAWYQGGISVFDFTDSAHPVEIAFFDRGPLDATTLITGGYWSAYWYNGVIYGSEIARGIDVFRLSPSEYLSQNEIDAAMLIRSSELNPQEQPRIVWPVHSVVARAYVDQLARRHAIAPERAGAVQSVLAQVDGLRRRKDKGAAAILVQLDAVAAEVGRDAGSASGHDAEVLRSLATVLKNRSAQLQ
jgi:hypothetical protein